MKTLIAAAALAATIAIARAADLPAGPWRSLGGDGGVIYRVNLGSIKRQTMDHSELPSGAKVLVYRDAGGQLDDQEFFTIVFDCRGRYMLWNHPENVRRIDPKSIASQIEDIACWSEKPAAN